MKAGEYYWKNIDPWQRRLLTCWDRYIILNCSRQSGKSSSLMVKAFWKALTTEDAIILIIAEQRQSNEDMRKVKNLVKSYDKWLSERHGGKWRLTPTTDNVTSVEFANGARIIALPSNEKVRGYSAPTMVILDEAAYQDDQVFVSVDPMLEVSNGQLILASTPKGNQGFFATEWKTNPRYTRFEVPWWDCPRISKESIERKRLIYGDAYVDQEYCCKFLDDASALFTEASLAGSIDENESIMEDQAKAFQEIMYGAKDLV